jgi:dCTP deaminase
MSDIEIKRSLDNNEFIIKDFDGKQLQGASYDARLGDQVFKTRPERGIIKPSEKGVIIIEPGEFVILTTHEGFELPNNIACKIGLRSHYARKGLILLSGPQIDPGFKGILTVGIYNVGPMDVAVPYLEPICTIEFYKLSVPATRPYSGEYQNQIKIPTRDIEFFIEAKGATLAEVIQTIGALGGSVDSLQDAVKNLRYSIWAIPIIIGVFLVIFKLV